MLLQIDDSISTWLRDLTFEQVQALDREVTNGRSFRYYESSQVSKATVYRNKISGMVGNFAEQFEVHITIHEKEISGACTCGRSHKLCKHVVTLLYSWVNDGGDFLDVGQALKKIKEMDKDRILEIVSNIIRHDPYYVDLFFAKNPQDWDEIDQDPFI